MYIARFEMSLTWAEHLIDNSRLPESTKKDLRESLALIASEFPNAEPGDITLHGYLTASKIPATDVPYGEGWARLDDESLEVDEASIEESYLYDDNSIEHILDVTSDMKSRLMPLESLIADYYNDKQKEVKFQEESDD